LKKSLRTLPAGCAVWIAARSKERRREALGFTSEYHKASATEHVRECLGKIEKITDEQSLEDVATIIREAIDTPSVVQGLKRPEDGAVAVFEGIVRNHTRGRRTLFLNYEAYEEMALKQMEDLAGRALAEFKIRDVAIVHRLGRLEPRALDAVDAEDSSEQRGLPGGSRLDDQQRAVGTTSRGSDARVRSHDKRGIGATLLP
jgi:hypothetical protein